MHTCEMHAYEMHAYKVHAYKVHTHKTHAHEVHAYKTQAMRCTSMPASVKCLPNMLALGHSAHSATYPTAKASSVLLGWITLQPPSILAEQPQQATATSRFLSPVGM